MGFIFVLKRIGFFIIDNWRVVLIGLAILVLLIAGVFTYRGCKARRIKLNQQELIELQNVIDTGERKKQEEFLVKVKVNEKQIDANVANSKTAEVNAIHDAKKEVSQMSDEELRLALEEMAK